MTWGAWENTNAMKRFKEVESQSIEPLITAAVGCKKLKDMLQTWEEGEVTILDEEMVTNVRDEIIGNAELVYQLANVAQSLQIFHKVMAM